MPNQDAIAPTLLLVEYFHLHRAGMREGEPIPLQPAFLDELKQVKLLGKPIEARFISRDWVPSDVGHDTLEFEIAPESATDWMRAGRHSVVVFNVDLYPSYAFVNLGDMRLGPREA